MAAPFEPPVASPMPAIWVPVSPLGLAFPGPPPVLPSSLPPEAPATRLRLGLPSCEFPRTEVRPEVDAVSADVICRAANCTPDNCATRAERGAPCVTIASWPAPEPVTLNLEFGPPTVARWPAGVSARLPAP